MRFPTAMACITLIGFFIGFGVGSTPQPRAQAPGFQREVRAVPAPKPPAEEKTRALLTVKDLEGLNHKQRMALINSQVWASISGFAGSQPTN